MAVFYIADRGTVHYKYKENEVPKTLRCYKSDGSLYYFRELDNKKSLAIGKFNICHPGEYKIEDVEITSITRLEIKPLNIDLPEPDRSRVKPYTVKVNHQLSNTPARNFTALGIIEVSDRWLEYPAPIKYFILLHEFAHFLYEDESNCDLWAAVEFIRNGYNRSTAYYSLSKVLKHSAGNDRRLQILHEKLLQ